MGDIPHKVLCLNYNRLTGLEKPMEVQFKFAKVCDSKMHYHDRSGGVDMPIIVKESMVNHTILKNVDSFMMVSGCSLKV